MKLGEVLVGFENVQAVINNDPLPSLSDIKMQGTCPTSRHLARI